MATAEDLGRILADWDTLVARILNSWIEQHSIDWIPAGRFPELRAALGVATPRLPGYSTNALPEAVVEGRHVGGAPAVDPATVVRATVIGTPVVSSQVFRRGQNPVPVNDSSESTLSSDITVLERFHKVKTISV